MISLLRLAVAAMAALALLPGCSPKTQVSAEAGAKEPAPATAMDAPQTTARAELEKHGMAKLLQRAMQGDPVAQFVVATGYINGTAGVPRNYEEGLGWMLRAANAGVGAAQMGMAQHWADVSRSADLLALNGSLIRHVAWLGLAEAAGVKGAREALDGMLKAQEGPGGAHAEAFRTDIVLPAQRLASAWTPCVSTACRDKDFSPPPPLACKERPDSIACLATR